MQSSPCKGDKVIFTLPDMLLLIENGIGQFRLQRKITMFFGQTANLLRLIGHQKQEEGAGLFGYFEDIGVFHGRLNKGFIFICNTTYSGRNLQQLFYPTPESVG